MNHHDIYQHRNQLFLSMSPVARGGIILFVVLGLLTACLSVFNQEPLRMWGSFLFNLMFFYSIALGGVAFGSMQDIIGAVWGRPIKRLHESFYSFIPLASVCFLVFFACIKFRLLDAHRVYSWIADPSIVHHFPGKDVWLQENFMLIRDAFAVIVIWLVARWHVMSGVRRDMALLEGHKDQAYRLGMEVKEKTRFWAAPVMVTYALMFSLLTFDLTMSLAPTWFSTLWAGWSFAIMMQSLMAFLLLLMFSLKTSVIGHFIKRQQFHDIGKLLHGFTVFFAYLTYAHVLTYWYTNMPEETSYFFTRLASPWFYFILASPFLSFALPFFLLIPKANKWTPAVTVPVCIVVLVAQWINYMLVVIPEVTDATKWIFPWVELGLFLGFLGLFFALLFQFGKKVPMVAVADPLLIPALSEGH